MEFSTDEKQTKTVVRLDKGDSVIESLQEVAENKQLTSGQIIGIGAVQSPTLGYYQLDKQEYKKDTLSGTYELTNLTGVITRNDGRVHIHAHATLADDDHNAFGGHLHTATIAAAGEFFMYHNDTMVTRRHNDNFGLDLMNFT